MTDECKKGLVDPEAGYGDDSEDSPSDAGHKKIKSLESRVSNTSPKSTNPCYRQHQHHPHQQHPHQQQQSQTLRNVTTTTTATTTTAATVTTTASSVTTTPPPGTSVGSTVNASASAGGGGPEVRKKVSPQGSTSCVLESSQSSSCRMRHKYIQRKSEGTCTGSKSDKMAASGILRGVLSKQSSTTDSAKIKGGSTSYSGGQGATGPSGHGPSTSTWKPLSLPEKKYLIAVERGDLATVRRFVENPSNFPDFNPNCTDPIGRSALLMAIDNENLEMIELLISYGVEMRDALLHAINEEFVEAVELLLDHEEAIHVPGKPWSWEQVEFESFTSDVTPLILAAHKNNYEIIKLILDRGISPIPSPHDARCGCKSCRQSRVDDHLRHSRSRINAYRALASPSLIALSSKDPILTAFELSWQLRRLSFLEPEFKTDYLELRKQCQQFATALLDHTRTTHELEVLLNYDPGMDSLDSHGKMTLSRLKLAIRCKQKKFCAHANVQQLLASIWYEGLPGFRRKNIVVQTLQIIFIGFLFPFLSLAYILAPCTQIGQVMKKPFIKFICHSASYMTFLVLLALASQRIESDIFDFDISLNSEAATKRGAPPTLIELMVLPWVLGLIWSEIKQLWELGLADYLSDMWNILDFITNSLYVATITLRVIAYLQVQKEISQNTGTAHLSRESWDAFDPILLAEGLFAAANIFSSLKLVYIFSVNPHLGPLQISLGRMVIDILKFFSVYTLVCFAFACGMNQLLWYYADMEKQVCIVQSKTLANGSWAYSYANPTAHLNVSGPIISDRGRRMFMPKSANEACIAYRKFSNLFESLQTLFWATFGLIDLENFELTGIQSYTRFWGMTMFGCYCIINVTVLLNLLIAMMNHSYQIISEQADTEWKFARTKLWMSYFEDGGTVPIPFNIIPTPKSFVYLFKWFVKKFFSRTKFAKNEAIKTIRRKARQASERDHRYQSVCRSLVRRYITNEQRQSERQRGVTEDDCNEIKQDISALRFELIELLQRGKAPNLFSGTMTSSTVNATTAAAAAAAAMAANGYSANFNPLLTSLGHTGIPGTCHNAAPGAPVLTSARTFDLGSLVNVVGKRGRKRERRLMKGFDFNFLFMDTTTSIDEPELSRLESKSSIKSNVKSPSSTRNKFVRLAKGIAGKRGSRANKWKQLIEATKNKVAKGNGESSQPPAPATQTPTQGPSDSNVVTHSSIPDSMADENWKTIDREDDDGKGGGGSGGSGSGGGGGHHSHPHQQHNTQRRHSRLSEFDLNTRRNLFARKVTTLIASGSSGVISGDRGTPVANDSLQSDPDTQGCSISLLPSTMDTGDSSAMVAGVSSRSLRKSTSSVSSSASYQSSYLPLRGEYSSDLSHRQLFHPSSTSTSTTASTAGVISVGGGGGGGQHQHQHQHHHHQHQHHHLHSQPLPPPPYPSVGTVGSSIVPLVPSTPQQLPPKLTVTLPANESSGNGSMGGESALEAPIESPVTGRSSKSPKKKRRNHSRSVTRSSRSRSRSPSKSPSKSPSPQSLNASVLIGLTQVRRSRNEWI